MKNTNTNTPKPVVQAMEKAKRSLNEEKEEHENNEPSNAKKIKTHIATQLHTKPSTSAATTSCAFDNGLIPDKIIGATESKLDRDGNGKLLFLMKWKNSPKIDLVVSTVARKICPQIVIDFYEQHLIWKDSLENLSKGPKVENGGR